MNTNNLDLELYNDLDESVLNAIGMNDNLEYTSDFCCGADGYYSNTNGDTTAPPADTTGAGKGLSAEQIQAGVQIAASVAQGVQQSRAAKAAAGIPTRKEIRAACGRKPIIGRKKKQKWNDCRDKYIAAKQMTMGGGGSGSGGGDTGGTGGTGGTRLGEGGGGTGGDDTFLGMPKGVGIAVAVIGGLALVAGGIYLVKKMNK